MRVLRRLRFCKQQGLRRLRLREQARPKDSSFTRAGEAEGRKESSFTRAGEAEGAFVFVFLWNHLLKVLSGLALIVLSITISSLFVWHIYLLSKNLTTIEYREAARCAWLAKKCGQNYRHPFDLGVYSNLESILGSNSLKWFCPLAVGHVKDGTQFPISND